MARTKGIGFLHVKAFVTERLGAGAWPQVLARFPALEQRTLDEVVSPAWYDLGLYARLLHVVDEVHGNGDPRFLHALGRFQAERDLSTITRWLLRLFRPSVAIEQMGRYWSRFHDTGKWTLTHRDDRVIAARLESWGVIDAALCRELSGYLCRTLELLGGREVSLEHTRCRARHDPSCEFRARWRLRRDVPALPLDSAPETPPPSGLSTSRTSAVPPAPRSTPSPSTPPSRSHQTPTIPPPPRAPNVPSTPPPSRPSVGSTPLPPPPPRSRTNWTTPVPPSKPPPGNTPSSPPSSRGPGSARLRPAPLDDITPDTRRGRGG
ncbi:4-vinyl reductase [Polyangium aurulentum]|uniref:4-vinyl reductase n=1 Tax=Polyangium aurulentum TaxID=2567896 RepID=UPI0010ADCF8B|nr:4-vinyl reductase [Polyangium aurulentum]UQA57593.1 4-vinyl reductase [Polyangium aurulentum]